MAFGAPGLVVSGKQISPLSVSVLPGLCIWDVFDMRVNNGG